MKRPIFCVHQIGKVGSTTVARALQRMLPQEKIHQTHILDQERLLYALGIWLQHPDAPRGKFQNHLASSIELRKQFLSMAGSNRWWVISLVRDPLARNVSAFFQTLHRKGIYQLAPEPQAICRRILKKGPPQAGTTVTPEEMQFLVRELLEMFEARCVSGNFDEWFDREVRNIFGIDVFARPFETERGYEIYQGPRAQLLLIRLEDLRRVFHPALAEFFANSPYESKIDASVSLETERSNDGFTKAYSDLYKLFIEELRVSEAKLEGLYGSRVSRHFYTEKELVSFRSRWKMEDQDE